MNQCKGIFPYGLPLVEVRRRLPSITVEGSQACILALRKLQQFSTYCCNQLYPGQAAHRLPRLLRQALQM